MQTPRIAHLAASVVIGAAVCLLIGASGVIFWLQVPWKWQTLFVGGVIIGGVLSLSQNPKRVWLFLLAVTVTFSFAKPLHEDALHYSLSPKIAVSASDVLMIALLFPLLRKVAVGQGKLRFFPAITIPALVWLVGSSLSVIKAPDPQLALIQLINMAKLVLLYWTLANSLDDDSDVRCLISGLLFTMFAQAVIGLYQGVTGEAVGLEFFSERPDVRRMELGGRVISRVAGTMHHPNAFGVYLTTVMPFALALILSRTTRLEKAWARFALLFAGLALVFSLSRSAWINSVLIFVMVLVLAVRRQRIRAQTAVLIVGLALAVLFVVPVVGPSVIRYRVFGDDAGSAMTRISMAEAAWDIFKSNFLIGVGLNNYLFFNSDWSDGGLVPVHNLYLLIAAETGVVGLISFVMLLAALLRSVWRTLTRPSATETSWTAAVGSFLGLVALLLHGLVDYAFLGSLQVFTQFWLLAGLSAALTAMVGVSPKRQQQPVC